MNNYNSEKQKTVEYKDDIKQSSSEFDVFTN